MSGKNIRRFFGVYWKQFAVVVVAGIFGLLLIFQTVYAQKEYIYVRVKGSPGNWWWVTPRPPDYLANAVKTGQKEYNTLSVPIAEVTAVDVYDAGGPTKDVFLTVKIEVKQNRQTKKYRFKGEPVEIGGPISLSLDTAFFPGMVVDIYGKQPLEAAYVEKIIVVRHNKRWPYEFSAFKLGDVIKDGSDNVIAEIIKAERRPAETETITDTGRVVRGFSPVYDDFFVTVRLKAREINGEYIYREEQYLKVGSQMWLLFPGYNMSGAEIVSID